MNRSIFKDIIDVSFSNIINLLSGIINGFVLPYVLGVTNYGYYRIFILYSTYTALLHCGFVDGILLKYGGIKFINLNKKKFRTYTQSFCVFEFIISFMMLLFSIIIINKFYSSLLIYLSIYTFIFNILTYYMFISQTTMQFKLLSIRNTCQALLSIVFTIIACLFYKYSLLRGTNYKLFICLLILTYFIMLLWYIYTYRDITFGNRYPLLKGFHYILKFCKIGIYLTISYQVSNLIMVIDNQFVSSLFKPQTYGRYSFSYGMSSRALVILGAVATVLLPHLKRDTFNHMIKVYPIMISYMMLAVYFALVAYFPLSILVKIIFPEYIQSLSYLKIFLPELGMTCCVTMIIFNYYNALHKSKFYFYMSLIILILSIVIDALIYIGFHNPVGIAVGSLISLFIWYIASEHFLISWYHVKWVKNFIYMILMISSFFIASVIPDLVIGFGAYLMVYAIVSWVMFRRIIRKNIGLIAKKI